MYKNKYWNAFVAMIWILVAYVGWDFIHATLTLAGLIK